MAEREFAGRTALVTGGSRGIGRAVCVRLAEDGAAVAVNYTADEDAAHETLRAVRETGAQGVAVRADVSDSDEVARMVADTELRLGQSICW